MLSTISRQRLPLSSLRCPLSLHRFGARSLSTSPSLLQSLESPTYPGLYYHSLPTPPFPKGSYSLSFLPTPPPSLNFTPTTIGVLSPPSEQEGEGVIPELLPRNFRENEDFKELMHDVLSEAVKDDLWIETMGKQVENGYIHIADERNPADPNRVPDPNDIIASLLIQEGAVVPSSYEKGSLHRIVTMDGMMKINQGLKEKLLTALEKVRNVEIELAKNENKDGGES